MPKRIALMFATAAAVIGLCSPPADASTLTLVGISGDAQTCQISGEWGVRAGVWSGFYCSLQNPSVGWELWAYIF
ncbi:MAG TPA: hypothetical protein VMU51_04305 [Mycobacteriales bacterium]|nr:hypothetical protein [Mycobacteriales bacterium]